MIRIATGELCACAIVCCSCVNDDYYGRSYKQANNTGDGHMNNKYIPDKHTRSIENALLFRSLSLLWQMNSEANESWNKFSSRLISIPFSAFHAIVFAESMHYLSVFYNEL